MESTISKNCDEHIEQFPFQHFHGSIYSNTKFKQKPALNQLFENAT